MCSEAVETVSTMLLLRASTIHCPANIMGIFPSVSCGLPLTSSAVDCAANAKRRLRRQPNPQSRQMPGHSPPLEKSEKNGKESPKRVGGRASQNTNLTYWYVELRNNLKVAALLQPLFGKVSSRNVVFPSLAFSESPTHSEDSIAFNITLQNNF